MTEATLQPPAAAARPAARRWRIGRRSTALGAQGETGLWLAAGALAIAVAMIIGLVALIVVRGTTTFWPQELVRFELAGKPAVMGEISVDETVGGELIPSVRRRMIRTGNYDLTGEHYQWVADGEILSETRPPRALVIERRSRGRFHGEPRELVIDGRPVASEPGRILERFAVEHERSLERLEEQHEIEVEEIGAVNAELESERLALRRVELDHGIGSATYEVWRAEYAVREAELNRRYDAIVERIGALAADNARYVLRVAAADGTTVDLVLADIVRAYPANALSATAAIGVYGSRWWEFLSDVPREANSEGGVFPAIFGTVLMTMVMSVLVVPFGVLAALYLREYAKPGPLVTFVRISVNNLAGVPSIVFGVFGFGFFCGTIGISIDELLFAERLPNPTYGTGGLLWASLTLALLTLPVVIVATEEAIAAVPNSMREGSYGCGATKWQTIRRIVLPRALPGIMTGMILAVARGAGEVAPLMLVGAVKLAPKLPIDGIAPFVHPERSFMHLGFHIFDLGFQSQNSEAAKPMVFTTTLLLITIVVALNLTAIWIRASLRRKYATNPF